MVCTGKEERLLECYFPENFGIFDEYTHPTYDYYNDNGPAPSHALPTPAPVENAPTPSNGLARVGCDRGDTERLSVICRRFEITGAATLYWPSWQLCMVFIHYDLHVRSVSAIDSQAS